MEASQAAMVRRIFSSAASWDEEAEAAEAAEAAAAGRGDAASGTAAAADDDGSLLDTEAVLAAAAAALGGALAPQLSAPATPKPVPSSLPLRTAARAPPSSAAATPFASPGGKAGGGGGAGKTVASHFRNQLGDLLSIIRATTPHYIRCLKPNSAASPKLFERLPIVAQLRCGGVLEAVRRTVVRGSRYLPRHVMWAVHPSAT